MQKPLLLNMGHTSLRNIGNISQAIKILRNFYRPLGNSTRLALIFCRKPTDVSYRFSEKGERIRVSSRTGRIIPKPPWERRDWKSREAVKGQ